MALKERELEATLDNMSQEKRGELRRKLDELDVEEQIATLQTRGRATADSETGAV